MENMILSSGLSLAERRFAAAYLEGSRALLLSRVRGLPPAAMVFRPGPGEWSVADCIEHCSAAEAMGWQWMQAALQEPDESRMDRDNAEDRTGDHAVDGPERAEDDADEARGRMANDVDRGRTAIGSMEAGEANKNWGRMGRDNADEDRTDDGVERAGNDADEASGRMANDVDRGRTAIGSMEAGEANEHRRRMDQDNADEDRTGDGPERAEDDVDEARGRMGRNDADEDRRRRGLQGGDYEWIISLMTDRSCRSRCLPMLEPSGQSPDPAVVLRQFASRRQSFISYALYTDDPLKNRFVVHPLTGRIDLYQLLILQSAHVQRHVLQIEGIKARYFRMLMSGEMRMPMIGEGQRLTGKELQPLTGWEREFSIKD